VLALLPPAVPQAFRLWRQWLAPKRPIVFATCVVVTLAALVALGLSKLNASEVLFDVPLHASQVSEIERALLLWNEPFRTDAQHAAIYVAAGRKRDILMRLALAGLPHRYVPTTADIASEQTNAFTPQAELDDRRRLGIEGDLVTSLRDMPGIVDAAVVIAPALADPLAGSDTATPASASVQVMLAPGAVLTPARIDSIKRFVAASYPSLAVDRVVVIDSSGLDNSASLAQMPGSARTGVESSIQSALDAVFGVGATVVRVSMRATGEERSSQRTLITPHGLLEAERGTENGVDSGKNYARSRSHTRYAYDTTIETTATHPDALRSLSVAVFVDSRRVTRTQTSLIRDVVRAAAGANLSNDQVVVAALPFLRTRPSTAPLEAIRHPVRVALAAGALAVLIAATCWVVFAHRTAAVSPEELAAEKLRESLINEMPQTAAYVLGTLPQNVRERVLASYTPQQRHHILAHLDARRGA
jgi:flagellar biosynthesis/type III secretory pathway M-ring protein FliF/YscJ